jgi:hypothetical protein
MNMLYIGLCAVLITQVIALKFNIRLLCIAAHSFFCYAVYQALQEPLSNYLLQNMYITLGYTIASTGVLLLCRRWPLLWVTTTTGFVFFALSGFPFEHKIIMFGLYALAGLILPTLYALKHHDSVFESSTVEMAFITPITIGYSSIYLMSEWLTYNKLAFKSITALLNWIYLLPITPYNIICATMLLIGLAPFLCAELLLYIAPEENIAIRRSLLIATAIIVATAIIQPSSIVHLCIISALSNLLMIYYKHKTADKRASLYLMLSLLFTGTLILQQQSPRMIHRLYQQVKERLLPVIKPKAQDAEQNS